MDTFAQFSKPILVWWQFQDFDHCIVMKLALVLLKVLSFERLEMLPYVKILSTIHGGEQVNYVKCRCK